MQWWAFWRRPSDVLSGEWDVVPRSAGPAGAPRRADPDDDAPRREASIFSGAAPDAGLHGLATGQDASAADGGVTADVVAQLSRTGPDLTMLVRAVLDGSRDDVDAAIAELAASGRADHHDTGDDDQGDDDQGDDDPGAHDQGAHHQGAHHQGAHHQGDDDPGDAEVPDGGAPPSPALLGVALAATGVLAQRVHPLSGVASRLPDEKEVELLQAYAGLLVTRAEPRRARTTPGVPRDQLLATSRRAASAAPRSVAGGRAGAFELAAALRAPEVPVEVQLRAACVLLAQTSADGGGGPGRLAAEVRTLFPGG